MARVPAIQRIACLALLLLLCNACQQDVARGLTQSNALRVTTTLRHHQLEAKLRTDGETYRVQVPKNELERAEAIIVNEDLLRDIPPPQQVTPRSGLDASQGIRKREEERAAAIATALRSLPQVREARVTLTLCEPSARTHELCPNPNQLSALLVLDPGATPPDEDALRRWLIASTPQASDGEVALLWSHAPSVSLPLEKAAAPAAQPHAVYWWSGLALLLLILIAAGALIFHRTRSQRDEAQSTALVTI